MHDVIDLRSPIRIAVAGLGAIGKQHSRILSSIEGVELVAVCDADPAARKEVSSHVDVPAVESWEQLMEFEPDAVTVALPTHLHRDSTRFFLSKGIPVMVEKPIAASIEEADELVELSKSTGSMLMVGHVERFNAGVLKLKELIVGGRLGQVVNVSARRVGTARPAVPHANVALDLAIHDVDVISFLLDGPGELISSYGATVGNNKLEDHVDLVMRYGDVFCNLQANWITPVKIRTLSVTGTDAYAELDYISQQVGVYEVIPETIKGSPWDFYAVSKVSPRLDIPVEKSEPLRAELTHFAHCVRTGGQPLTTASEARNALRSVYEATVSMVRA